MSATIETYFVGAAVELSTTFSVDGVAQQAASLPVLEVVKPDESTVNPTVTPLGAGKYEAVVIADLPGHWWYRWLVADQAADEGEFDVRSNFVPAPPPDLRNIRVLVPRVQRSIEGVIRDKWQLNDDQVKDLVADACADIILYTGSVFGSTLKVTARDPVTGAPSEYATDQPMDPMEAGVIAAQAALTYFYHRFAGMKTSEQISDEASHWEWAISPSLLVAQLNLLKDTRDRALEAIESRTGLMESYVSFLAVRDTTVSRFIEPWVYGHPEGYGLGAGGLEGDYRFGLLPGGGASGDYTGVP